MNYIESKDNNKIKLIRKLSQRKNRESLGLTVVEGLRAAQQAINLKAEIEFIAIDENQEELSQTILQKTDLGDKIHIVKSSVFDSVAETVSSQGIIALVKIPKFNMEEILGGQAKRLLLIDRVQDPGNFGTLIRTADAAGFDGIICSKGTVDAYSGKVNRSAMGSNLYIPIVYMDDDLIQNLSRKYSLYAATLAADSQSYSKIQYKENYIIALGNEANGLSQKIIDMAKECIHIPMYGQAESLNVAIAGSILMFKSIEED